MHATEFSSNMQSLQYIEHGLCTTITIDGRSDVCINIKRPNEMTGWTNRTIKNNWAKVQMWLILFSIKSIQLIQSIDNLFSGEIRNV